MKIKIGSKYVGKEHSCFIIAEAGVNHNGDIELAKKLIDKAKKTGADAVKFQTFKSEQIVTLQARQAEYQIKNIGKKESQYLMLKKLELSYDDFRNLKKYCDKKRIIFLSTPHSCKEDMDLVAKLCPAIKISSGDLTNLPMLKYAAAKKLPIILSTGMANMEEVKEATDVILPKNKRLILLHCTTNYPTPLKEVNLKAMQTMAKELDLPVGYSDHTQGIKASMAAVAMGACVIEKHFTLSRKMFGPDHKSSLESKELKEMIDSIRGIEKRLKKGENSRDIVKSLDIEIAMGSGIKKPNSSEIKTVEVGRKSIVAAVDIKKGTKINKEMIVIKRPGTGIMPKYFDKVVGKTAKKNIKKDELINYNQLKNE